MTDILGPADAPNAVTTRPADDRSFASLDSWFKDCTSPTADDGTDVEASWLNSILAAIRAVWRANGTLIDGTTKVVPETGTNDAGILDAIKQLIQRGQLKYAVATGTANALALTLAPAMLEYKEGTFFFGRVTTTNTGAATLNVNGLGARDLVRNDGGAMNPGDLYAGMIALFSITATKVQVHGLPQNVLTGDRDYYISASGNDANDGLTSGTPWATLQHAYDWVQQNVDLKGHSVVFHVANGTYAAGLNASGVLRGQLGAQSVLFQGNNATPANVLISIASGMCIGALGGAKLTVSGMKVQNSGGSGIVGNGAGSEIIFGAIDFGTCTTGGHINAHFNAVVSANYHYTISGGANAHMITSVSGSISVQGWTITLTGTPAFPIFGFASAQWCSAILADGNTYTGSATGPRYLINGNAVIYTAGGGASYFPGNSAGSISTGGQYF